MCIRCTNIEEVDACLFPGEGEVLCPRCKTIPSISRDITIDEKDGMALLWKGTPFYSRGKLTTHEGDEYVLASYVNVRMAALQTEVDELKALVGDLMECARDGSDIKRAKK